MFSATFFFIYLIILSLWNQILYVYIWTWTLQQQSTDLIVRVQIAYRLKYKVLASHLKVWINFLVPTSKSWFSVCFFAFYCFNLAQLLTNPEWEMSFGKRLRYMNKNSGNCQILLGNIDILYQSLSKTKIFLSIIYLAIGILDWFNYQN